MSSLFALNMRTTFFADVFFVADFFVLVVFVFIIHSDHKKNCRDLFHKHMRNTLNAITTIIVIPMIMTIDIHPILIKNNKINWYHFLYVICIVKNHPIISNKMIISIEHDSWYLRHWNTYIIKLILPIKNRLIKSSDCIQNDITQNRTYRLTMQIKLTT